MSKFIVRFSKFLKSRQEILDIGCGAGIPNDLFLAGKGLRITGIDISAELLKIATKNIPKNDFIKADILKYRSNKKFSGIIAWDSLFHLKLKEHKKVFKKIYSLLKNNGYFLFTHGGSEGEVKGNMFGERFSYSSLGPTKTRLFLEQIGFKIVSWVVDEQPNNKGNHGHMVAIVQK